MEINISITNQSIEVSANVKKKTIVILIEDIPKLSKVQVIFLCGAM